MQAVKMLALTAYDDDAYRKRAEQVGFDGYYTKPMDPTVLYQLFGDSKDVRVR
jgi:DNA-binding NarL/FixJ family response regulator